MALTPGGYLFNTTDSTQANDEGFIDASTVGDIVEKKLDEKFPTTKAVKYDEADPDGYNYARYHMKDAYGLPRVSDLNEKTRWAAQAFKVQKGWWPGGEELVTFGPYIQAVEHYASGMSAKPPAFGFKDENGGTQWVHNSGVSWSQPSIGSLLAGTGAVGANIQNGLTVYPSLDAVYESLSPVSTGGGGGGGGGGGVGRAPRVFDRDQLSAAVTERWRGRLLEEPDEATVQGIVSDYINKANAFWMSEAGSLDFDTFVVGRIEATDRHTYLYEKKPAFQSPEEYMTGFRQTANQFGMNDRATLREVEAGAHSGAGLQGFGERVSRTAEVRAATGGTYSQRFAGSMAQSGIGRT